MISFLYIVDCKWGEWKKGKCSKECGGNRHDTRDQEEHPMYGGKSCSIDPGHERIVKCCDGCPGKKCPGITICLNTEIKQASKMFHELATISLFKTLYF